MEQKNERPCDDPGWEPKDDTLVCKGCGMTFEELIERAKSNDNSPAHSGSRSGRSPSRE